MTVSTADKQQRLYMLICLDQNYKLSKISIVKIEGCWFYEIVFCVVSTSYSGSGPV